MSTEDLRPVGDEYDYGFEPVSACSQQYFSVHRFRVIAHEWAQHRGGLNEGFNFEKTYPIGEPFLAARLDTVSVTKYPCTEYVFVAGKLVACVPQKIAHLFPTWPIEGSAAVPRTRVMYT